MHIYTRPLQQCKDVPQRPTRLLVTPPWGAWGIGGSNKALYTQTDTQTHIYTRTYFLILFSLSLIFYSLYRDGFGMTLMMGVWLVQCVAAFETILGINNSNSNRTCTQHGHRHRKKRSTASCDSHLETLGRAAAVRLRCLVVIAEPRTLPHSMRVFCE